MTKLQELRQSMIKEIDDVYIVDFLIKGLFNLSNADLISKFSDELTSNEIELLDKKFKEVINGKPVQYVVGEVEFYNRKFEVDDRVLIPRQETAELVDYALQQKFSDIKILDIGTGSGILAVTLAKEIPGAKVTALDISSDALIVAKKNAKKNDAEIKFIESDLLDNVDEKFDLIVSNPPYIAENDTEVEMQVDKFEPHLALYAGTDGLDIYRRLIPELKNNLNNDATVIFEIGYKQSANISKIITDNYPDIKPETIKDFYGQNRFIAFKWKL